jgi:hypothetical protein
MAVDFSTALYLPNQDMWGRPVTITPVKSQPTGSPYQNRGIFDTRELNVILEDGSILADQETILDIRTSEYAVPPIQGDLIDIPADPYDGDIPARGQFVVDKANENGGGEITLVLKSTAVGM